MDGAADERRVWTGASLGNGAAAARFATAVYRVARRGGRVRCETEGPEPAAALTEVLEDAGLFVAQEEDAGVAAVRVIETERSAGAVDAGSFAEEESGFGDAPPSRALRVGLLGLGTVGRGVAMRLAHERDRFAVVSVLVRDLEKHRQFADEYLPGSGEDGGTLLTDDAERVFEPPMDVLVELIGGVTLARAMIIRALDAGIGVITANKALIAEAGPELAAIARDRGALLAYSAAVGGGMPAIETVRRAAAEAGPDDPIVAVRGVLNGTCNYLVNEFSTGAAYAPAVAEAQRLGYAEADPTMDLDGTDAAQKLVILSREGMGAEPGFESIERETLDPAVAERVKDRAGRGEIVRQVTSVERQRDGGLAASVAYRAVDQNGPLGIGLAGALNAVEAVSSSGRSWSTVGSGAGRGPTAQSVYADLVDAAAIVTQRR